DDDGRNWGKPLKVNVTVKKRADSILIDLTGSADEVETGYNVPFEGSLQVACFYIVRTLFLDEAMTEEFIPQNSGMFRPVSVHAPKGSIFNPNFPRACVSRMAQVPRVLDCVIQALAPVLREQATAGNSAHVMSVSYSGYSPAQQQYWVCVEVNEGSYGARRTKDGPEAVDNRRANTRNVPCEEIEMRFPLRVERYELRPEAPGAGEWRGGIGAVRDVRFLADGFLTCNGDRTLEAPKGIFGGGDGLPAQVVKTPGSAQEVLPSKSTGRRLKAGDVIRIVGPNAGGYGKPRARAPQRVAADVADGLISAEHAREVYGVVVDPRTGAVSETPLRKSLARINAREREVHAWTHIASNFGQPSEGPLHGLPVGVKDVIDTADMPTEYG